MRVRPSVGVGVVLAIGYMALFGGLFYASGVDYDAVTDTADNVRSAIVVPLAIAAVVLIVVTTILGWWGPVLRDRKRAQGWLLVVPILLAVALLISVDYANLADLDSELVLYIGIAVALVGFCEELVYRGLLVVSFRGSMSEAMVWLWTSIAFGLLHSVNALLGQGLGATLSQVIVTTIIGSAFYISRRATGFLVVPMVLHLLWDYSAFTQGDDHALAALPQTAALVLVIVALTAGRRYVFGTAEDPVDESVPEPAG